MAGVGPKSRAWKASVLVVAKKSRNGDGAKGDRKVEA